MQKYLLSFLLLIAVIPAVAQFSNVTYSTRSNQVTGFENPTGGSCWESGEEEYTSYIFTRDNVDNNESSTGCQQCNNNGNCTYSINVGIVSNRTNNANYIVVRTDMWEDDHGDRCSFGSDFFTGDDCRRSDDNVNIFFRRDVYPSATFYSASSTFGSTSDHQYIVGYTWKYASGGSSISVNCGTWQATNAASGDIRSWSFSATSGRKVSFKTCDGGIDTYLRIYGSDGYTIVAQNDDNGPHCASTAASLNYIPTQSGTYFVELSQWTSGNTRSTLGASLLLYFVGGIDPPSTSCPSNIFSSNDGGQCGATISYSTPTFSDDCPGAFLSRISGPASGSFFPVGATSVTWQATDVFGNNSTCTFTVNITDTELPIITCPVSYSVNSASGQCGATVSYNDPPATDNCPGVIVTRISGPASGSFFPFGTTNINYQAMDTHGQSASCVFSITVTDNQNPVITCPQNITVNVDAGLCSAVVSYSNATATDNCGSVGVSRIAGLESGSAFLTGTSTIGFLATDAVSLTANCSFTITVIDNMPPTITCPDNILLNSLTGQCGAFVSYNDAIATDNCSLSGLQRIAGLESGSFFPPGNNAVIYRATDINGNTSACTFSIIITDAENPVLACPANISVNANTEECSAIVNYQMPSGTDNCPGANTLLVSGLPSGSVFPGGVTPVSYEATDAAGLKANCSFTVTVNANCNDSDACTDDACVSGTCQHTSIDCADSDPCTTDGCEDRICTHLNNLCDIILSGLIHTEDNKPVPGVSVVLSGTENDTVVTTGTGTYSFTVAAGGNYTITPYKSNDVVTNNGVTTGDIPLIRKQALTQNFLTSPYKVIAADANNSGTVTTADVTFTRRVALNNTNTFPQAPSPPIVFGRLWEFVDSDQLFSGPPYNPFPFTKTRTYNNLNSNQTNQDFIGIKIGDVNNNWNPATQ